MKFLSKDARRKLKDIELFVLDIDGTFSISGKFFEGSLKFAVNVERKSKKFVFLTNNSNKSLEEYLEEFEKNGLFLDSEQVFTAGIETAEYLYEKFGSKKIYIVGTSAIKDIFERAGHKVVEHDPEIVVVTFDKSLNYEKLAKASTFVSQGKLFVITNPDLNCPSRDGPVPDTGAIASVIVQTTGRKPDIVFGKPEPLILEMVMKKFNVQKHKTCVVGDRLYTDILLGIRAEVLTILVLTGEAKEEDVHRLGITPDIIANDIGEIADFLGDSE
ncbi:HAD-IIA family hydrolase [Thermosipho ferrireducens]|uniref:HAD-IIA family hydrolase n=1 Tax=Thermosipho ferrireducens TaxID=2571116 RepID=A0ABX7S5Q4_9BACT|nr:HAD-IIA family hydrolase [Thermosipho ferrireducens]QTA37499.1 HAD-IIA family hydrolase [Thermosipho ferrireducens]